MSKSTKSVLKRASKSETVADGRGPGRPPKFTGPLLKTVVKAIKANGGNLSHARLALKKIRIKISLPTIGKLARRNKVAVLSVGRPALAA